MKKIFVFCIALVAITFFLGKKLSPLDGHFFTVHDNTQAARIQEFALNLKNGVIPPRLAPDFSFQHGFPVFNFYAPFTYWVGSIFHISGFSTVISLKLVIFLGLVGAFISFFLLGSLFFGFWGGLLGGVVYSSSLWMAVEIFVRGNIGEIWFMALLPLCIYLLKKSDAAENSWFFLLSTVSLSFLFTVHNVLSLVSVIFIGLFSLGLTHKKKAFLSMVLALLLGAYFLFPAVLENKLTYATEIAARTKYSDHFLCTWQLWKALKWSYGGSGIGCINDDMSFQIGKAHILIGGVGLVFFLLGFLQKKKRKEIYIPLFILGWTILSAFLTLYASQAIWEALSPIMASFQFPWRFLPFVVFGVAFFAGYVPQYIKYKKISILLIIALSAYLLYSSSKFFSKPWMYTSDEFTAQFLTEKYIQQKAAYEIPEYFPRSGNYKTWRTYDSSQTGFPNDQVNLQVNTPFYKEIVVEDGHVTIPIHYFPFWQIQIEGKNVIPKNIDSLGRPFFSQLAPHTHITVRYNETPIEKVSNSITLVAFGLLLFVCFNKKLWKRMNTILQ